MRARSFRSRLQHDLVAACRPSNIEGVGDDPFTEALITRCFVCHNILDNAVWSSAASHIRN